MAKESKTNTKKSELKTPLKKKSANIEETKEIHKNITFGLMLIALLVAGFCIGSVISLLDNASKPQTTIYTRDAKAYNNP